MYDDADVEAYCVRLQSPDAATRSLAADEATDGVSDWGKHSYTSAQADRLTRSLVEALRSESDDTARKSIVNALATLVAGDLAPADQVRLAADLPRPTPDPASDHWPEIEEWLTGNQPSAATPPVEISFVESPARGIDLNLGAGWPGFNEALADSVSTMPYRGEARTTLSTYWIDLVVDRIRTWDGTPECTLVSGNVTELVKAGDLVIARSLYELADDEALPVPIMLTALQQWRNRVVERGGRFEIPETYRRAPYPMPKGGSGKRGRLSQVFRPRPRRER